MNTRQLISDAWFLSGIVSPEFQAVGGDEVSNGLTILNDTLAEKSITTAYIPYYTQLTFNGVVGQEEYFIPNLVEVTVLTFDHNEVRYTPQFRSRNVYWGRPRVNDIDSWPLDWTIERTLGGTKIFVYFRPIEPFEFKITGKFALAELELDTDLSLILERYYLSYLKYLLAKRLCDWRSYAFSPGKQATLKQFEDTLFEVAPMDTTAVIHSTLNSRNSLNYAQINLGGGYWPS